jgi:hypothetical protein
MRKLQFAVTIAGSFALLACRNAFAAPPTIDWTASYNGPGSYWESVSDATVQGGSLHVVGFATTSSPIQTRAYITVKYAPDGSEAWSRIYEGFVGHANESDVAQAVAVDASGSVYVTGYSAEDSAGSKIWADAATLKYATDGTLVWERRYRGSGGNVQPSAIVLDPAGFLYVTGGTWTDFGFDIFLLKYDLDGNLLWARTRGLSGARSDHVFAMALAPDGDVVLGGYTQPGTLDVYVLRYGPDGTFRWEWTLHGAGNVEEVIDLTVDAHGNTYALAQYAPPDKFTSLLTVKLDPAGRLLWSDVYSGQSTGDYAAGIELAPDGSVFAAGAAWENGSQNAMTLIKYGPGGQRLWSRSERGGYFSAECNDLNVGADGAAYLSGFAFDENGREDYLTAKFDGAGNRVWTTAWSAPEGRSDIGYLVRVGSDDRVFVVGDAWRDFSRYYDITTVAYRQNAIVGVPPSVPETRSEFAIGPNPVVAGALVTVLSAEAAPVEMFGVDGRRIRLVREGALRFFAPSSPGIYMVRQGDRTRRLVVLGGR